MAFRGTWRRGGEKPVITPESGTTFDSALTVTISCPTEGATIHYTTDGSEPTQESSLYNRFRVTERTTVKARAFDAGGAGSEVATAEYAPGRCPDPVVVSAGGTTFLHAGNAVRITWRCPDGELHYTLDGSDVTAAASFDIAKVWGIGDTMGRPDRAFATSGDKPFVRVEDATATRGEAMRSGAVADNQTSVLSTTVVGPGTVSFRWKTSCEADEELHDWDHAVFAVDGVEVARQDGVTDWLGVSHAITNAGAHAVTWTYVKDDGAKEGADCVWVADFAWTSDELYTHESATPVPYAWIREQLPHTPDEYPAYEAAAKSVAANGHDTVEGCYIAGLDPNDPESELRAQHFWTACARRASVREQEAD